MISSKKILNKYRFYFFTCLFFFRLVVVVLIGMVDCIEITNGTADIFGALLAAVPFASAGPVYLASLATV